jgi:hypothetical protein
VTVHCECKDNEGIQIVLCVGGREGEGVHACQKAYIFLSVGMSCTCAEKRDT